MTNGETIPPPAERTAEEIDLLARLHQIAEHDWRRSIIAHTSDTAAMAIHALTAATTDREADRRQIAELEAENTRQLDQLSYLSRATPPEVTRLRAANRDLKDHIRTLADALATGKAEGFRAGLEAAAQMLDALKALTDHVAIGICDDFGTRGADGVLQRCEPYQQAMRAIAAATAIRAIPPPEAVPSPGGGGLRPSGDGPKPAREWPETLGDALENHPFASPSVYRFAKPAPAPAAPTPEAGDGETGGATQPPAT